MSMAGRDLSAGYVQITGLVRNEVPTGWTGGVSGIQTSVRGMFDCQIPTHDYHEMVLQYTA